MPYTQDNLAHQLDQNYIMPNLSVHIIRASYEGEHKLQ